MFSVAKEKRSHYIEIRHRDGKISCLIHECGSESCAHRMTELFEQDAERLRSAILNRLNIAPPWNVNLSWRAEGTLPAVTAEDLLTVKIYAHHPRMAGYDLQLRMGPERVVPHLHDPCAECR